MANWLENAHTSLDSIFNILWVLRELAEGLETTGNPYLAKKLHIMANELEIAHKSIRNSLGESICEANERSQKMTKTVVEAALAGILIERKDKNG